MTILLFIVIMLGAASASSNANNGDIKPDTKVLNLGCLWNDKPMVVEWKEIHPDVVTGGK